MGKIHQDYHVSTSVFLNSYQRPLASISSKMLQYDAFYIRPNHFKSIQLIIYYEQVNTPPSTIFQLVFRARIHWGGTNLCMFISHTYNFVMLLINLKFCIMRFLSQVIPLTLSGTAFSVFASPEGGSEAQMPKIEVNINQLK